jgi:hypothetical protein
MNRIRKHAEAEPTGKSHSFPERHFWYDRLTDGSIKDR